MMENLDVPGWVMDGQQVVQHMWHPNRKKEKSKSPNGGTSTVKGKMMNNLPPIQNVNPSRIFWNARTPKRVQEQLAPFQQPSIGRRITQNIGCGLRALTSCC
ncbi:unnamed protein product [Caenorhabditis nigoni]